MGTIFGTRKWGVPKNGYRIWYQKSHRNSTLLKKPGSFLIQGLGTKNGASICNRKWNREIGPGGGAQEWVPATWFRRGRTRISYRVRQSGP